MMRFAPSARLSFFPLVGSGTFVSAESGRLVAVTEPETPPQPPMSRRLTVGDFLLPLFAILTLTALVGWAWRWFRRPTRGLRREVRRARRFNEAFKDHEIPESVPEMELERRAEMPRPIDPEGVPRRRRREPSEETEERTTELAGRHQEALERLERLHAEVNPKDPIVDYRRLDGFVRRYLFEFHGIAAFGQSAAAVVDRLLQQAAGSTVVDYAGEILMICELAELPRHRPSHRELHHLFGLAAEMIRRDARDAARRNREEP